VNTLNLTLAFLKIGILSFGGGFAGITFMEREIVKNRGWMDEDEFLRGLALVQLAPGPVMTNLAAFIGYRLKGVAGGATATLSLLCPSFCLVLGIAVLFDKYSSSRVLQALLNGVTPAVLGILAAVTARLALTNLRGLLPILLALVSFTLIFFLGINSVHVMLGAVLLGLILSFKGTKAKC
jgi:chromate transporter